MKHLFNSARRLLFVVMVTVPWCATANDNQRWTPWLVPIDSITVHEYSSEDEDLASRLNSADSAITENVDYWQGRNPNYRWMQMALNRYAKGPPSPHKGRGLAMLNLAIYDAVAVASSAKVQFQRPRPNTGLESIDIPDSFSYPSAHAAAAGAAAGVLSYLFPDEKNLFMSKAKLAAAARVDAGVNFLSDVDAGLLIGQQVSEKIIEYAAADGSDKEWNGTRPTGADKLKGDLFVYPGAGDWQTVGIKTVDAYVPAPPPAIDSEEMIAQLDQLKSIERNVPNAIRAWTNHSTWRAYQWWYEYVATAVFERGGRMSVPEVALAYATIASANHDAVIACFNAKYTYWFIRPAQLDATVPALFPNPPHPSYPAAHSCSSMSFATVIGDIFPEHLKPLHKAAEEAGYSRLIGGIHYPMDKAAGEEIGRGVANEVLQYVKSLSN